MKWQQKAQEQKTGYAPKTPPTLVQKKKESRQQHLPTPLPANGDEIVPLQYRKQLLATDPDDNEPPALTAGAAAAHYHVLQILQPADSDDSEDSELTPDELVEALGR